MVSGKTLIFFVAVLLFIPEKNYCKFEEIGKFLKKYEVSKSTQLTNKFRIKFTHFDNAEKSIEIKGFGKSFILDLSIYFHHEDADINYISQELNSTGRYRDLKALLYQGQLRDTNGSYAVGFFNHDNLFRGYFITDEVYCVEPHEDKTSVIVYKLNDVIFPGCSKTDCSKTKYFEPWKPSKVRSKVKFDYRVWYDKYLKLFSDPGYQKDQNGTHTKKDSTSDSKDIGNDPDHAKNGRKTGEKGKISSSIVSTNGYDVNNTNHHNDTEKENGNENNHHNDTEKENGNENNHHNDTENEIRNNSRHQNDEKNKYEEKESIKIIDTNHHNATNEGEEHSSEKYRQNKDELGRWLSVSNGNHSEKNETDRTQENNKNGGENKTHSDVDSDNEIDDDEKIPLSKYATELFQMNSSTTSQDSTVPASLSFEHHNTSHVDNETQVTLNSMLFSTKIVENNSDNLLNDISSFKIEGAEEAFASSSSGMKSVQKRHYFIEDLDLIPYASIDRFDIPPTQLECSLEILISPAFRKKFNNQDADAIKDIFTQITFVNKLFQRVVLKRKDLPFHLIFRIGKLIVFRDEFYSPFEMKGEMEDNVNYFNRRRRSCLNIGLTNKILQAPLQFVDGYLPKDEGGACSSFGNFFVVSHGDGETPAPMGLYFAALVRGLTRGFGANDESEKCKKGDLPNPMQVLRDDLLVREITPGRKYSIFTECNIQDIEKALNDRKCLVELQDPFCGNAIIDEGEECDCGPEYMCQALDSCCTAHLSADQKIQAWLAHGSVPSACKLVSKATCGLFQPCCDQCVIKGLQKLCFTGTGPCDMAYCDGEHADCSTSVSASDGLICNAFNATNLEPVMCKNKQCEFGLCTGSGLTPCTCAPDSGKECLSCCMKDGKCKAAVSDLHLREGEDLPLLNGANCTGGLCFRGRCVLEAGIEATNASNKNPASMIRSDQDLTAMNTLIASVITLSILLMVL